MAVKHNIPFNKKLDLEFDEAFNLLNEFVDLKQAGQRHPLRSNAVYTTSVVLWMLVYSA
ncbi:MAG: hypothetical protein JKY95_04255 [Planctomycetaceae bacterium]|nr:hypothetical protein [Planctomycetaceae bacterium]